MVAESPPWQRRWYRHPKITQLHVGGAECRLQAICKADHNWGLRWQRRGSLARSTAATRACHRGNRLSLDKISSPSAAAGRSAVPPLSPAQAAYGVLQPTLREARASSGMDHAQRQETLIQGQAKGTTLLWDSGGPLLHHGPRSAPPY